VSESGTVNAVCARCGQVIDGLVLGPGLRLADYEHMARIVDGHYAGPCGGELIERATGEAEEHACAECGQPNDRRRAVAHPELCGPCYVLGAPALRYE
jgi:ribosomal protein L34E